MHCTNLAVTLRSECCSSKLHFANSCIAQTLLLLSVVIDAHPRSILLFLCIAQTFALTVNSQACTSMLYSSPFIHFTDLALTPNSHCCTFEPYSANFMHCTVVALAMNSHYWPSGLNFSLFMHSSVLVCILNGPTCQYIYQLNSAIFIHWNDLALILNSHYCQGPFFPCYALHRSCSQSQLSLLRTQTPFRSLYAFHRPWSYSQSLLLSFSTIP